MAKCEVCGNEYDKAFRVEVAGTMHTFDSFECAIHALAPVCAHCGCTVLGHGVESDSAIYCCAHCAEASGVAELRDRADHQGGDADDEEAAIPKAVQRERRKRTTLPPRGSARLREGTRVDR
jgi:hypothetical protein